MKVPTRQGTRQFAADDHRSVDVCTVHLLGGNDLFLAGTGPMKQSSLRYADSWCKLRNGDQGLDRCGCDWA